MSTVLYCTVYCIVFYKEEPLIRQQFCTKWCYTGSWAEYELTVCDAEKKKKKSSLILWGTKRKAICKTWEVCYWFLFGVSNPKKDIGLFESFPGTATRIKSLEKTNGQGWVRGTITITAISGGPCHLQWCKRVIFEFLTQSCQPTNTNMFSGGNF